MSESWLLRAAVCVELNSVKAELVKNAWDYRWSCVHAHLSGKDIQGIVQVEKLLSLTGDWKDYLLEAQGNQVKGIEQHERTGRPLGGERFIEKAEHLLQRELKKKKTGPEIVALHAILVLCINRNRLLYYVLLDIHLIKPSCICLND